MNVAIDLSLLFKARISCTCVMSFLATDVEPGCIHMKFVPLSLRIFVGKRRLAMNLLSAEKHASFVRSTISSTNENRNVRFDSWFSVDRPGQVQATCLERFSGGNLFCWKVSDELVGCLILEATAFDALFDDFFD